MKYKIKYIAKCRNNGTGKIIKQKFLKVKTINLPKSFHEFGLCNKEQIELIKHSQDFILDFPYKCFSGIDICLINLPKLQLILFDSMSYFMLNLI